MICVNNKHRYWILLNVPLIIICIHYITVINVFKFWIVLLFVPKIADWLVIHNMRSTYVKQKFENFCDIANSCCLMHVLYDIEYLFYFVLFFKWGYILLTGAVVDVMSGTTYIVMRSILSKIVPHAELGTYINNFHFLFTIYKKQSQ